MNQHQCNENRLNFLWNCNGNKRYSIKKFIHNGKFVTHIVFEDKYRDRDVLGKVVVSFSEGEVFHWPRLHHQSLAPLLDAVSINANLSILISTHNELNLREIVHDEGFISNPNCFTNKKFYMGDVLRGLDYLHGNSLVHMNLSDANIYICLETNKAVISDFSCLKSICQAKKNTISLPPFYQAPEVSEPKDVNDKFYTFNPIAAEMWAFGVMTLEVFLQHKIPWALVDYNSSRALEILNYIDLDTLKTANKGSDILHRDSARFKEFTKLFLTHYPYNRCDAGRAALATFLQPTSEILAHGISSDWNQLRITEEKSMGDNSTSSNSFTSTKGSKTISRISSQQKNENIGRKVRGGDSVGENRLLGTKSFTKLPVYNHRSSGTLSSLQSESFHNSSDFGAISAKSSLENLTVSTSNFINDNIRLPHDVLSSRKAISSTHSNRKRSFKEKKLDGDLTHQTLENAMRKAHSVGVPQESKQTALPNHKVKRAGSNRKRTSQLNLYQSRSENFVTGGIKENKAIHIFKRSFLSLNNEPNRNSTEMPGEKPATLSQNRLYCSRSKSMHFVRRLKSYKSFISLRSVRSSKHNSNSYDTIEKSIESLQISPALEDLRIDSYVEQSNIYNSPVNAEQSNIYNSPVNAEQSNIYNSPVNAERKKPMEMAKSFGENKNSQSEVSFFGSHLNDEDSRLQNSRQHEEVTGMKSVRQNQVLELGKNWNSLPETNMTVGSRCIFQNRFHCPVHCGVQSSNNFLQKKMSERNHTKFVKQPKKYRSLHLYKSGPLSNCYYSQISENTDLSHSKVETSENNKIANFDKNKRKYNRKHSYKRAVEGSNTPSNQFLLDEFHLNRKESEHKKEFAFGKKRFVRIEVVSEKPVGTVNNQLKKEKVQNECSRQKKVKCHKVKKNKNNTLASPVETNNSRKVVVSSRKLANDKQATGKVNKKLKKKRNSKNSSHQTNAECNMVNANKNTCLLSIPGENMSEQPVISSKIHTNDKGTTGTVARKLENKKIPKDCYKLTEVRKPDQIIKILPSTEEQAMISRRSVRILTEESPNNPKLLTIIAKPFGKKKKRKSFKNAALKCLCLGDESV